MQTKNLLIDLDDTLLENNMDTFAPGYYNLLSKSLAEFCPPDRLFPALMAGTKAMMLNTDPSKTLETAFDEIFYPQIGINKPDIAPKILSFYENEFNLLQNLTKPIPEAKSLVEKALNNGYQIVIATNPLFPQIAIDQRLMWAGLPAHQYPFKLVTSYEHMHFCKPNPKYYLEILSRLSFRAEDCMMVGNDLEADIKPAIQAGLKAFHLADSHHANEYITGSLNDLISLL